MGLPRRTKFIEEAGRECDGLTVKLAKMRSDLTRGKFDEKSGLTNC
jgi:hypothetical protein